MRFINVHTHEAGHDADTIALVNQYPLIADDLISRYSIGIHPWYINMETADEELAIIERHLIMPNCLALGECGLDKRTETPFDIQQSIFKKQLMMAQQLNKPVIIHCVAAFQELIAIRKKLRLTVPMIIHGFSKSVELAKQLVDNEFYLSFGKRLMLNPELEPVILSVPIDRLFLETDNNKTSIADVYSKAAQYKRITSQALANQLTMNFDAVFSTAVPIKSTI